MGEEHFKKLENATGEQIEERVKPFARELHTFLNRDSCIWNVQRRRQQWVPKLRRQPAFDLDDFVTDHEHWYTYYTGGRNEAQFNIGFFPAYMRVGLGFEFTRKSYGEPEKVQAIYDSFCRVVSEDQAELEELFGANGLQIEWLPTGKQQLEYVGPEDAVEWLLAPEQGLSADWIFLGRLLSRSEDSETLNDPTQLKSVMDEVFGGFKDYWEQANFRGIKR